VDTIHWSPGNQKVEINKKEVSKMEEAEVKKEMGKRLVDAMDPLEAKIVLSDIIAGADPFVAILGRAVEIPVIKKKRKKWTRKTKPIKTPAMTQPTKDDLPF
jgi:hypothetical protein